jgi:hypothetical protein
MQIKSLPVTGVDTPTAPTRFCTRIGQRGGRQTPVSLAKSVLLMQQASRSTRFAKAVIAQ